MPTIISGSTGISGTDGTAATPAVQGTDTNTGIFFPAADTIAFAEGGTEVMRIDSNGRVGIGTTTPATTLNISTSATQVSDNIGYVQIENTTAANAINASYTAKNFSGTSQFMQWENNGLRIGSRIVTNSGQGAVIFTAGNDVERMRIDSSGRVTMPAQPAFRAFSDAGSYSTTGVDIAFPSTTFNIGSHYNTSNGRFTAPVTGTYLVLWSTSSLGATNFSLDLHKNGSSISFSEQNNSLSFFVTGQSQLLNLSAGDFVTLRLRFGTINLANPVTNFQGFLVC